MFVIAHLAGTPTAVIAWTNKDPSSNVQDLLDALKAIERKELEIGRMSGPNINPIGILSEITDCLSCVFYTSNGFFNKQDLPKTCKLQDTRWSAYIDFGESNEILWKEFLSTTGNNIVT